MEFLLFLGLSSILGFKFYSENSKSKAASSAVQSKFDQWKARTDAFIAKYRDDTLEINITRSDEYKAMSKKLKNDLGFLPSKEMVKMAAMAMHGKIPVDIMRMGIGSDTSRCADAYARQKYKQNEVKFLKYYDKLLREHGVDEMLMYYPDTGLDFNSPQPAPVLHLGENGIKFRGCYRWPSMREMGPNTTGCYAVKIDSLNAGIAW